MADVINLADFRAGAMAAKAGRRDPEKAEVFPGVSLADLWRLWAKSEIAKRQDALGPSRPASRGSST
ncbi:hypothetical protein [Methylobacterium isbiliense]|jgi:hypothetical protein|uniref:Uncharacterized protein n=1 Tax=Methylobacterium isbiliense TaxID=315478 RepID=A0ABQ4SI47_9HYPH|nr:hypothetical protein [Methylobacterium isbiliense]MDN3623977.1 hypothetical protein [Methylobacterium isbiliense]GJE02098.1 hypothetical protein GMJLKIPL_4042 [Methylobacterium isbiliense]